MKTGFSSKIGITLTSIFLILSLVAFSFLNGSTAWFAENKSVSANDMGVEVKDLQRLIKSVDYYPISSITLSGSDNIYTFSSDPIPEGTAKTLGTFSTLIAERQLLVKITLHDGVTGAHVGAVTETDGYIADSINSKISKEGNPLSSVVEFYSVTDVAQSSEGYVISSGDIADSVKRFVTLSEYEGEIISSFDTEISLYSTAENDHDHVVFIMIDYYEQSVEYVMDTVNRLIMEGEGKTDAVLGENIEFVCDFKFFVF